jgi:hypothetical protein
LAFIEKSPKTGLLETRRRKDFWRRGNVPQIPRYFIGPSRGGNNNTQKNDEEIISDHSRYPPESSHPNSKEIDKESFIFRITTKIFVDITNEFV